MAFAGVIIITDCRVPVGQLYASRGMYDGPHFCSLGNPCGIAVEEACEVMHDAHEKAATGAGWETNPASRKPWACVPEANKVTMRAAVTVLLGYLDGA